MQMTKHNDGQQGPLSTNIRVTDWGQSRWGRVIESKNAPKEVKHIRMLGRSKIGRAPHSTRTEEKWKQGMEASGGCSEENFQNSLEASSNASISSKAFYNDASTLHSPAALAPLPLIDPPATPAQTSRAGGRPKSEHISPIDPSTPRRNSQGQLSASKITVQLPAKQASATTPNSASPGRDYEAEARRRKQKEPFTPTMVLRKQPPPFNVSPQRPPDPKVKRVCEKAEKALKQEVQRRNETQQRVQILAQQHARDAAAQNKLRIEREAAKISTLEKLRLQQLAERNARVQSSILSGTPLRSHTVVWFSTKIAALKNMISAFNCFSKAPQPSTNA